jgi:hypothetical protein
VGGGGNPGSWRGHTSGVTYLSLGSPTSVGCHEERAFAPLLASTDQPVGHLAVLAADGQDVTIGPRGRLRDGP